MQIMVSPAAMASTAIATGMMCCSANFQLRPYAS
jgi:hypothetical protein